MNKANQRDTFKFQEEQNDRWLGWLENNYPDFNPDPSHDEATDEEIRDFYDQQDELWDEFLEYESSELGITPPNQEYPNEEQQIAINKRKALIDTIWQWILAGIISAMLLCIAFFAYLFLQPL
jgi:hypothetical protein